MSGGRGNVGRGDVGRGDVGGDAMTGMGCDRSAVVGRPSFRRRDGGFFLVIVLIVIVVATMAVYSFTELMIAYDESSYLAGDLVQARVNVESAADTIRLVLSQPRNARVEMGGVYNNPQLFQAITVSAGADGATPSNFTVLAPGLDETGRLAGIRYGLQDESARLNVNALLVLEENSDGLMAVSSLGASGEDELMTDNLAVAMLMALPGMSEDTADAILDWIDEDDEPRPFGAESEYYSGLPTPYEPANGPLQSVEELLLVRGVTPELLFGVDANRNGVLDADEQQRYGVGIETPGALGWAAYLTVHGAEANKTDEGLPRVNVNQDDLELLYEELLEALGDEELASFIVAYRVSGEPPASAASLASELGGISARGGSAGGGSEGGGRGGGVQDFLSVQDDRGGGDDPFGGGSRESGDDDETPPRPWSSDVLEEVDLTGGGGTDLTQILDLIGAEVTIGDGDNAATYVSPLTEDPISLAGSLPLLMDTLTTQDVAVLPGRINLNGCPAELLYAIPVLDQETVDAILQARQDDSGDLNRRFETWPLAEGIVTLEQMRLLLPLVTGGGDVYRAQVIGYFETIGASHRSEIIIDATTVNPKIVAWRDLSHLGRGFDRSVLGIRSTLGMTP